MGEFKSFYKTVSGNEGQKCHYPTRLDTYGCGCAHDCKYCYAKSLLEFRKFWNPEDPSVADIKKIENKIKTLKKGSVIRLGGMTDCFQPCENQYKVTYETIKLLNKYGIHYLIVTKSNLVASDEYVSILDKKLAHIQITVTSKDDALSATYEHATPPSKRIVAIEKLQALGFDVQIRLSPFIPEFLDMDIVNNIKCDKAIVEFLRVNAFIRKTFHNINYEPYTLKEGGYNHLELEYKKALIKKVTGFKEISVCEDSTEAYEYWKSNVNFNKDDCCNLRLKSQKQNKTIASPIVKDEMQSIGNKNLLLLPKTAFLSSIVSSEETELAVERWAYFQVQNGNCIISGFQSPTEKKVLDILLKNRGRAIIVLPTTIPKKCPQQFEQAVNEKRFLIISYFDENQYKATRESAEIRNSKVIEMANKIVVGCIKHGGMTEKLLAQTSKPKYVLDETVKE